MNVGATMDLTSTMSATQLNRFAIMDLSGMNVINADTLRKTYSFSQNIPVATRFGLSLEKIAAWMVGVDYSQTDWSKVDNNLGRSTKQLPVSTKWSIGGEFTPDFTSVSNYFKRTTYRFGFSYAKTPMIFLPTATMPSTKI